MTVRFNTSLCTIYRTHSRTSTTSSEEVTYTFQGRQSPHSPPRGYSSYLPDSQLPELDKTPMRRGKKVHVLLGSYLTFYAPAVKWLGHILLPHSVITSFCHSVIHIPIVISTTIAYIQLI